MLTYIRAVFIISGSIKLVIFMTANLLAVVLESGTEVATLPFPALMKIFQRMEMLKSGLFLQAPCLRIHRARAPYKSVAFLEDIL